MKWQQYEANLSQKRWQTCKCFCFLEPLPFWEIDQSPDWRILQRSANADKVWKKKVAAIKVATLSPDFHLLILPILSQEAEAHLKMDWSSWSLTHVDICWHTACYSFEDVSLGAIRHAAFARLKPPHSLVWGSVKKSQWWDMMGVYILVGGSLRVESFLFVVAWGGGSVMEIATSMRLCLLPSTFSKLASLEMKASSVDICQGKISSHNWGYIGMRISSALQNKFLLCVDWAYACPRTDSARQTFLLYKLNNYITRAHTHKLYTTCIHACVQTCIHK